MHGYQPAVSLIWPLDRAASAWHYHYRGIEQAGTAFTNGIMASDLAQNYRRLAYADIFPAMPLIAASNRNASRDDERRRWIGPFRRWPPKAVEPPSDSN